MVTLVTILILLCLFGFATPMIYEKGRVQGLASGYEVAILILQSMSQRERDLIKARLKMQAEAKMARETAAREQSEKHTR